VHRICVARHSSLSQLSVYDVRAWAEGAFEWETLLRVRKILEQFNACTLLDMYMYMCHVHVVHVHVHVHVVHVHVHDVSFMYDTDPRRDRADTGRSVAHQCMRMCMSMFVMAARRHEPPVFRASVSNSDPPTRSKVQTSRGSPRAFDTRLALLRRE